MEGIERLLKLHLSCLAIYINIYRYFVLTSAKV